MWLFPVAVGHFRIETVPALAAPITARHVCRRSSFINKHKLTGIDPGLILSPGEARFSHVRAILLGCHHGFF